MTTPKRADMHQAPMVMAVAAGMQLRNSCGPMLACAWSKTLSGAAATLLTPLKH
jgi:hypothetical protein